MRIENKYEIIWPLGKNIKRPYLDISFKVGGHNKPFTYRFRPDTGFVSPMGRYLIKSCEFLERMLEEMGISPIEKESMGAFDGRSAVVRNFECLVTKISGSSRDIKPKKDIKAFLFCAGCRFKKMIYDETPKGKLIITKSGTKRFIDCQECLKEGTPNVFGFELMNLWIAEFNGPDQKFSIKTKDV